MVISKKIELTIILLLSFIIPNLTIAQTQAIRAIQYKQITNFEENLNISSMKMSADGSRIVFSSSGQEVKVYTINTDGSGLTEVYDFQRTGLGVFVDITADGEKVIFSDGDGEIYIAFSDGSARMELASLLPNPNPHFEDFEPYLKHPPRITNAGGEIYFLHSDRSPDATGLWRVNSNNTGLTQIFSFREFWSEGLHRTDEIPAWSNFSNDFDISADGSKIILGTNILKLEEQDYENGNAYVFDGGEFYHLGDYRIGSKSLTTNATGDNFMFFREEFNSDINDNEINLYISGLPVLPPVKVMEKLSWPSFPMAGQMSTDGSRAVVLAGGGTPHNVPVTLVNTITKSHFDLVNCDDVSLELNGFRMSYSYLPSMNHNGDRFSFVSASVIPQIWTATLSASGTTCIPAVSQTSINPPYITYDGSVTSTISTNVVSPGKEIQAVYFDALKEGTYSFRSVSTNYPYRKLFDDGTNGDEYAEDHFYTNNSVQRDLPETEPGEYTIRISATDGQNISAVDVEPFSILEEDPTGIYTEFNKKPTEYALYKNYPNPFNPSTSIKYSVPENQKVVLKIFDLLGRELSTLVDEEKPAGNYVVEFTGNNLSSGIYFYRMQAGEFIETKKLMLLK